MKRVLCGAVTVGVMLALAAGPLGAQLVGSVVQNGAIGPGVMVAGDYTRGLNDDSQKTDFFGGRIAVGLPMISFWGGLGIVTNGESEATFGGGAAIKVFDPPLVPVNASLQAGLGFLSDEGGSFINVPIGVAITIDVPSPAVSIKPWAMPRLNFQRLSPEVGDTRTEFGFGASGGLIIGLPNGVGAHATLDWMTIDFGDGPDTSTSPLLLNVGLNYTISVPSLGII